VHTACGFRVHRGNCELKCSSEEEDVFNSTRWRKQVFLRTALEAHSIESTML